MKTKLKDEETFTVVSMLFLSSANHVKFECEVGKCSSIIILLISKTSYLIREKSLGTMLKINTYFYILCFDSYRSISHLPARADDS